jgi:U3 small nucleolar RNA-associated protein 16
MAPPKTRKRKSDQNISETKTSEDKRKLPVRAKDGDSESVNPAEPQGTKVVFGDDDETVAPAPMAASKPAAPVKEEESDEDSDDEAPEAVSTSKVASDIKKSKQAAQKAAQE